MREIGGHIGMLSDIAHVSKSGYFKWLKRADKPEKDHEDYVLIKEVFDKGRGKYGWRTLQMKLRTDKGVQMNHKKIIRIKNKYDLVTKIRRRNPYRFIGKKTREHRTFKNRLNRRFKQKSPYKVFCTDITYLPFQNKMVYLSAIKDIASREIVAWNLSNNLSSNVVLSAIENMKKNQTIPSLKNALMHSDQGIHFSCPEFVGKIKELKMVQSMSRRGNCIDNAPMESFFGHFKDDIDYKHCKTFEEIKMVIAKYMEYYNNERPQWNLKKMTPVDYRNHLLLKRH